MSPREVFPGAEEAAVARTLGLEIEPLLVDRLEAIDTALAGLAGGSADALVVLATAFTVPRRQRIADLAAARRLPALSTSRAFVDSGVLIVYGPDTGEFLPRAATIVDKILKGTPPGDIPLERPTRFEFILNFRTAEVLGLTIPPHLSLQVTEAIR